MKKLFLAALLVASLCGTAFGADLSIDLSGLGLRDNRLELDEGEEVDRWVRGTPEGLTFRLVGWPQGFTITEDGHLTGKYVFDTSDANAVLLETVTIRAILPDGTGTPLTTTEKLMLLIRKKEAPEEKPGPEGGSSGGGGGGCNAGFLGITLALAGVYFIRRR